MGSSVINNYYSSLAYTDYKSRNRYYGLARDQSRALGDGEREQDALNDLVSSNLGLVGIIVNRFIKLHPGCDVWDVNSIAMKALWDASKDWNVDGGASLGFIAGKRIRWALGSYYKGYVREMQRRGRYGAFYAENHSDRQSRGPVEEASLREMRGLVRHALGVLEPVETDVITRRYLECETYEQIAQGIGRTKYGAQVIERRALGKLRIFMKSSESVSEDGLTDDENEVLRLLNEGFTYGAVGRKLSVSKADVKRIETRAKNKFERHVRVRKSLEEAA